MKQLVKYASVSAVAFAMTMMTAASAQAQTKADVSVGYQFAHLSSNGSGETFPYGFYVDASGVVRPMIAIVGEFGGIYKSESSVTVHQYTYQGGVRVFSDANPMWTPFGQVLIGGATEGSSGSSANAFSLQIGGGLNIKATAKMGARVAVDYRRVFFSDTNGGGENDVRVALGVVFPIGK